MCMNKRVWQYNDVLQRSTDLVSKIVAHKITVLREEVLEGTSVLGYVTRLSSP